MKMFLRFGHLIVLALIILLAVIGFREAGYFDKFYSSDYFSIEDIKSDIDYDNDAIDDYTDILLGAKEFVSKNPKYKDGYYDGGYPSEYFVCTDVFWYALKNAGYDFKSLIDEDIKANKSDYNIDIIDPNIDFRRVRNIHVFLEKYATKLTNDGTDYKEFNLGDIIIYEGHIALVSDKRNKSGISYIIHHDGHSKYEEDGLLKRKIIGHFRWELKDEQE